MAKRKKKTHEIELYSYETFYTIMEYELKRAKRFDEWITLVRLSVEAESTDKTQEPQFAAEIYAINVLNIQLREVDIPCRLNNEFLVLMPCTDEVGGRIVCERLEKLFLLEAKVYEKVAFNLNVRMGFVSLPSNKALTSKRLMDSALLALDRARANRSTKPVVFSEVI